MTKLIHKKNVFSFGVNINIKHILSYFILFQVQISSTQMKRALFVYSFVKGCSSNMWGYKQKEVLFRVYCFIYQFSVKCCGVSLNLVSNT